MAIIPRANPADITRIDPLPGVRNTTRVDAGPSVSDALAPITRAVVEYGQQQQDRADTAQYLEGQTKLAAWKNGWTDPNNDKGMSAYKGKDALTVGDAMLPDYDKTVGDITSTMSQRAKAKFLGYAGQFKEDVRSNINTYATAQHEGYIKAVHESYVSSQMDVMAQAKLAGDDQFDKAWGEFADSEATYAAANGVPAETLAESLRLTRSALNGKVADNLLATDAVAAQHYVDAHEGEFTTDDLTKMRNKLSPLADAQDAIDAAQRAFDGTSPGDGQPAPVGNVKAIQSQFHDIASKWGSFITSGQRAPLKIGAGAGSQHIAGTAADFRTNGLSDDKVNGLMADLRAAGYEVIDERNVKDKRQSTGPHIHAELPKGATATQGAVASQGSPKTQKELLDRLKYIVDPVKRRQAEAEASRMWSMNENAKAQQDSDAIESMRSMVGQAPPGQSLLQTLGENYNAARDKGWLGSLQGIANARDTGTMVQTNPITFDQFSRMAAQFPREFGTPQTRLDIIRHAHELSTQDLNTLLDANTKIMDPKTSAKAQADWSTAQQRINDGVRTIIGEQNISNKEKAKTLAAEYGMAYRLAERAWMDQHGGKKPVGKDADALSQSVTRNFLTDKNSGQNAASFVAVAAKLSPETKERVRQQFIAAKGRPPTETELLGAAAAIIAGRKE